MARFCYVCLQTDCVVVRSHGTCPQGGVDVAAFLQRAEAKLAARAVPGSGAGPSASAGPSAHSRRGYSLFKPFGGPPNFVILQIPGER